MKSEYQLSAHEKELIRLALAEDLGGRGDITSIAMIAEGRTASAHLLARESCTVCGNPVVREVFRQVDDRVQVEIVLNDGAAASPGDVILRLHGPVRSILTGERTALNFMQRLTGVATLTHAFTERVKAYGTMILDTRKTTPGFRTLEKYAVQCGGGSNHRMGLYDRVLIKDNHRAMWAEQKRGDLGEAVRNAREMFPDVQVELEVETLDELRQALPMHPDWVLLDNMPPETMRECVALCRGVCKTEASGGITMANVEAAAASGVDAISLGCLTHSARAVDLSLEMD